MCSYLVFYYNRKVYTKFFIINKMRKRIFATLHAKRKLLFCCSLVVMLLLLKGTIFDGTNLLSMEDTTRHLEDNVNEAGSKEDHSSKPSLIYKAENLSDQTKEFEENTYIRNKKERNNIGEFPYGEECFFSRYPNFNHPKFKEQNFSFLQTKEGREYKTILAYFYSYGPDFSFGLGHKPFEAACCREKRCFMTDQTDKISIGDYDAVIIHFRGSAYRRLPKPRKQHQRFIFYEKEPPTQSSKNPESFEGIFNWTMTYRRDSDIVQGYGRLYSKSIFDMQYRRKLTQNLPAPNEILRSKSKKVAWMVSHCDVPSKRDQYVRILQRYIQVDVYGSCGTFECDRKDNVKCYEMMEKSYKFYLSFENSLCVDYVTEKFFNILNYYIVPVVRGLGNYSAIAPPHSYIDTRDFTIQELAKYLNYLDKNDTAYLEYFKWKNDYLSFTSGWIYDAGAFCELCYKLHNDHEEKTYSNLKEWFHNKSQCMTDNISVFDRILDFLRRFERSI